MKIRVIESETEFYALKQDWDKLADHSTNKFDWIYKWWKCYGKNCELKILVAEENNRIIGIVPLCINRSRIFKLFSFQKLSFLGSRISDYSDFLIINNKYKKRIFGAFFNYMLNHMTYDALEFNQVNSLNSNINLWKKYIFLNDLEIVKTKPNTGLDMTKFQSYQDYLDNFLSKKLKNDIKQTLRKLTRHDISLEYVIKKDINESDMAIVSELGFEKQKYAHKKHSSFADPTSRKYLQDYFLEAGPESKLLAYIKFNDIIVAYTLLLVNSKIIYYYDAAFLNDYAYFQPAKLLLNELVRYSFDNKFEYFDFMRGEESYKSKWANNKSINYNIVKDISLKARLVSLYRKSSPELILKMLCPSEIKI